MFGFESFRLGPLGNLLGCVFGPSAAITVKLLSLLVECAAVDPEVFGKALVHLAQVAACGSQRRAGHCSALERLDLNDDPAKGQQSFLLILFLGSKPYGLRCIPDGEELLAGRRVSSFKNLDLANTFESHRFGA